MCLVWSSYLPNQLNRSVAASAEADTMERVLFWWQKVLLQCAPCVTFTDISSWSLQTTTKESKWDMPEELLLLMEKVEKEAKEALAPPAPSYAARSLLVWWFDLTLPQSCCSSRCSSPCGGSTSWRLGPLRRRRPPRPNDQSTEPSPTGAISASCASQSPRRADHPT